MWHWHQIPQSLTIHSYKKSLRRYEPLKLKQDIERSRVFDGIFPIRLCVAPSIQLHHGQFIFPTLNMRDGEYQCQMPFCQHLQANISIECNLNESQLWQYYKILPLVLLFVFEMMWLPLRSNEKPVKVPARETNAHRSKSLSHHFSEIESWFLHIKKCPGFRLHRSRTSLSVLVDFRVFACDSTWCGGHSMPDDIIPNNNNNCSFQRKPIFFCSWQNERIEQKQSKKKKKKKIKTMAFCKLFFARR